MATEFNIPNGYTAPDGTKKGQEFTEIATFKFDGKKMTLLTIGQDKIAIAESKDKPKGVKDAVKEQLGAMEDKKSAAAMEDTESPEEEMAPEEEMD